MNWILLVLKSAAANLIVMVTFIVVLAAGCSPTATPPAPTPAPSVLVTLSTPVPVPTLSATELKAMLDRKDPVVIYDARSRDEYNLSHLPGAQALPMEDLEKEIPSIPRDRLVVLYCHGGT